jgi:antitoxin component of MazEF toxin-antitoxin module
MRRKIEDQKVRKIFESGDSYAITLPKDLVRELGWQDNQKLVAKRYGDGILFRDWEEE